jgi:hypothetical protein
MFALTFDLDGIDVLEERVDRADAALIGGVLGAVSSGASEGETYARANHPYTDRSNALTGTIHGSVESGDANGAVALLETDSPYARAIEYGSKPHEIRAKPKANGKPGVLAWNGPNGPAFARSVQHPGTSPLPFMVPARDFMAQHIRGIIETIVVPRAAAELAGG